MALLFLTARGRGGENAEDDLVALTTLFDEVVKGVLSQERKLTMQFLQMHDQELYHKYLDLIGEK